MKIFDGADFLGALIECRSAQHETKAKSFTTVDLRKNICQGYIFLAEYQIKFDQLIWANHGQK